MGTNTKLAYLWHSRGLTYMQLKMQRISSCWREVFPCGKCFPRRAVWQIPNTFGGFSSALSRSSLPNHCTHRQLLRTLALTMMGRCMRLLHYRRGKTNSLVATYLVPHLAGMGVFVRVFCHRVTEREWNLFFEPSRTRIKFVKHLSSQVCSHVQVVLTPA